MEKQFDASILVRLAGASEEDEFTTNLTSLPDPLKKALQEQKAAKEQKIWDEAAKLILKIYNDADKSIKTDVQNVREARRKEAQYLAHIKQIKRAKAYGEATNNYLPLARLAGVVIMGNNTDHYKLLVPADWVDPTEATPKTKVSSKPKQTRTFAKV